MDLLKILKKSTDKGIKNAIEEEKTKLHNEINIYNNKIDNIITLTYDIVNEIQSTSNPNACDYIEGEKEEKIFIIDFLADYRIRHTPHHNIKYFYIRTSHIMEIEILKRFQKFYYALIEYISEKEKILSDLGKDL